MSEFKIIEDYKGYGIAKNWQGTISVFYPDGLRSCITSGSVKSAKKIIDIGLRSGITVWDIIEVIYPGVEEYKKTA